MNIKLSKQALRIRLNQESSTRLSSNNTLSFRWEILTNHPILFTVNIIKQQEQSLKFIFEDDAYVLSVLQDAYDELINNPPSRKGIQAKGTSSDGTEFKLAFQIDLRR